MKSLVEYINERGPAPLRLKCSVSGKPIPDDMILSIGMGSEGSILRVFKKLEDNQLDHRPGGHPRERSGGAFQQAGHRHRRGRRGQ